MFFTLEFSATPLFYGRVSSAWLRERPKFCKWPLIYSRLDVTLHQLRLTDLTSSLHINVNPDCPHLKCYYSRLKDVKIIINQWLDMM